MKIIGVAGRKGSGKDTFALPLIGNWIQLRFADPLKDMLRSLLLSAMYNEQMIERFVEGDLKETPIPNFGGKTMREMMQSLGTEWGRNMVVHDLWLRMMLVRLRECALHQANVVITDCRYPNEVEFVQNHGGYVVRINRQRTAAQLYDNHSSETQIDKLEVDCDVENNSDIITLHAIARRIANTTPHSFI